MIPKDPHSELKKYLGSRRDEFIDYQLNPYTFNAEMEVRITEANSSLDRASSYSNAVVHHCGEYANIPVKILSLWFKKRIGEFIQMPTFFSTTKAADVAFKGKEKVFEIHTSSQSNGKDVSTLGFPVAMEQEITFKSDTFFKIVSVTPELITLEEISFIPSEYEILYRDYFKSDREVMEYFEAIEEKRPKIQSLSDEGEI